MPIDMLQGYGNFVHDLFTSIVIHKLNEYPNLSLASGQLQREHDRRKAEDCPQ